MPDQTEPAKPNPYELACERFNRISGSIQAIKAQAQSVIDWADQEWEAAQKNLRQYETSPGIPLPEYGWWPDERTSVNAHTDGSDYADPEVISRERRAHTPCQVPELHTSPWDAPGCTQ